MQALTELIPSSAVTHAVSLPFLSRKAVNLIVAKTSLLQVFEVQSVHTNNDAAKHGGDHHTVPGTQTSRFSLVGEFQLAGTVTSLASIKILKSRSGGAALLVSFKDAKISLVEWNPETYSLSTISIHYYEGEDMQTSPWTPDLGQCRSFLLVDPSSRCAALKFGQRHLAILPFRQHSDDLAMDEFDTEAIGSRALPVSQPRVINGIVDAPPSPYGASFVLPLTALDLSLLVPIDLAFLFEYREPTVGILFSTEYFGPGLLQERREGLTYIIFTLDLEQHARTPLVSVTNLPSDLSMIVPLPLPVGGTLLLGGNEVIHVDQAGKTHAIGVNDFAKQSSTFPMSDQSSLGLKLEGSIVVQLQKGSGDMLVILNTGDFAILSFKMDGRSVSGLSIRRVPAASGGSSMGGPASCAVLLQNNDIFLGATDSNSLLVRYHNSGEQPSRKRSHAEMNGEDVLSDEDIEDEDDLYGHDGIHDPHAPQTNGTGGHENFSFNVLDKLPNLAPFGKVTISYLQTSMPSENQLSVQSEGLTLTAPVGRGKGSNIALLTRGLHLSYGQAFDAISSATSVWSVVLYRDHSEPLTEDGTNLKEFVIISTRSERGEEVSAIYSNKEGGWVPLAGTNFEEEMPTLDVGAMSSKTRLVQVCRAQLNCYDIDLGLAQIFPMIDEVTDAELTIVHTSFADPYLLVVRDDSSVVVLRADDTGDLDEVERGDALLATKWLSGSIHKSSGNNAKHLAYLLSSTGGLHVFELPNMEKPLYTAESLCYLPPILVPDLVPRRAAARETLTELLVAELGDSEFSSTYLMVRTANDDVVLYRPYSYPATQANQLTPKNVRWAKIPSLHSTRFSEESELDDSTAQHIRPMKALDNLDGYKSVFIPGSRPSLLMKESSGIPRAFTIAGTPIQAMSGHSTLACLNGVVLVDAKGAIITAQLPRYTRYDFDWAVQAIPVGQDIESLAYHATSGLYVLGVTYPSQFQLPEDDWHRDWVKEDISFQPSINQGALKLMDPSTWTTFDEVPLAEDEIVLCVEALSLEASEITGERRLLVAVGTSVIRGEDLQNAGNIYIFDVIPVVPEADRPETNRKLKLIVKEEVKGPVTAIAEISSQGYLIMAQGQKCMIRGLKEDNTLLPVAFLDVQTYVSSLKTLKGTGMTLVADGVKGVWFAGFSEEPNKIAVFGKSRSHMDVAVADFLPHEKELFVLIADADGNMHVLEYNPEHPKSLSGQRLLLKSTFHTGHFPVSMTLLPSTYSSSLSAVTNGELPIGEAKPPGSLYQTLVTTQSGALLNITPLDEQSYRRLGALQNHLTSVLDHPCGLNPRAYRNVESEGFGSRGILDGGLIQRWNDLGSQRRADACARVGAEEWQVRSDLEMIGGGGLGYL